MYRFYQKESNNRILQVFIETWLILPLNLKKDFIYLILTTLICAFLEIFSISSIIPILNTLQKPDKIIYYGNNLNALLNINLSNDYFIISFFIIFIILALLSTLSRILLVKRTCKFSAKSGIYLSNELLKYYIFQDYKQFKVTKASDIITTITIYSNELVGAITRAINVITSSVIFILIFISLLLFSGYYVLGLFSILFLFYFLSRKLIKKKLTFNSKLFSKYSENNTNILNIIIRNYKEIVLQNNQQYYLRKFYLSSKKEKFANVQNQFLTLIIKYLIEGLAIIFSAIMILFIIFNNSFDSSFAIIGVIFLALQKMLPLTNQIFSSWSGINSKIDSIEKVLNNIKLKLKINNNEQAKYSSIFSSPLENFDSLELKNISYFDNKKNYIIKNLNLVIKKGDIIGIKGFSGSGKTTLIEIIMGLLKPSSGKIYLNNREIITNLDRKLLSKYFSCVYQSMFIGEKTIQRGIIADNNYWNINKEIYKKVTKIAELGSLIDEVHNGDKRDIGEFGSSISGGQMQRIAIARSIYRDKEILVFDEATNALDKELEEKVLKNIISLGNKKTFIFITHNDTVLQFCNRFINLS
tara:strand:- start:9160 stop:10911 length:1752 start_codon:yes stop_codon:yes gene_type:complete